MSHSQNSLDGAQIRDLPQNQENTKPLHLPPPSNQNPSDAPSQEIRAISQTSKPNMPLNQSTKQREEGNTVRRRSARLMAKRNRKRVGNGKIVLNWKDSKERNGEVQISILENTDCSQIKEEPEQISSNSQSQVLEAEQTGSQIGILNRPNSEKGNLPSKPKAQKPPNTSNQKMQESSAQKRHSAHPLTHNPESGFSFKRPAKMSQILDSDSKQRLSSQKNFITMYYKPKHPKQSKAKSNCDRGALTMFKQENTSFSHKSPVSQKLEPVLKASRTYSGSQNLFAKEGEREGKVGNCFLDSGSSRIVQEGRGVTDSRNLVIQNEMYQNVRDVHSERQSKANNDLNMGSDFGEVGQGYYYLLLCIINIIITMCNKYYYDVL